MQIKLSLNNLTKSIKKKYKDIIDLFSSIFPMNLKGEDLLSNRIAIHLVYLFKSGKLNCIWFHVPNETIVRTKADFACLKKKRCIGMIPGVADFVFIKADSAETILIELKHDKGSLSDSQEAFQKWSEQNKTPYFVVRSLEELIKILFDRGFIKNNDKNKSQYDKI